MGNFLYTITIYPLTQIIELVFSFCNKLFDNEGIALIGVSLAVSLLTLPLYIVAEAWQNVERNTQKKMKPQIDRIKSTFKGSEQYMILTTYYSQCHYHPLMSLRSAFGLLIQIPFFTAAYSCLSSMTALKNCSFLFIKDLGAQDATFMIGNFPVNILPITMTIINLIAAAIYLKGLPLRDKLQTYGLAFVFLALLYASPAGLVVYWTMNNIFSLVKNVFYKMKNPVKNLYRISCILVTILIAWMHITKACSLKQALIIDCVFSLVYFTPLFVKVIDSIVIDKYLAALKTDRKRRFSLFIASTLSIVFLLGLYIPTQLIASSPMEFSNIDGLGSPIFFVKNTFFQALGLCLVWPTLVYFLFKERIQTLLTFTFLTALMLSLVNSFVFFGNYGILSKHLVYTGTPNVYSSIPMILVNILAMALLTLLILFLLYKSAGKALAYISVFLCFGFAAVSAKNISQIRRGYSDYLKVSSTSNRTSEIKPVFHLSKTGKNVILIFLDRAQARFVETELEESPVLKSQFTGFTNYSNSISCNPSTLIASSCSYGGYEYTPEQMNKNKEKTLVEKHNESLLVLPRIFSEQADFTATITDPSWANFSWISDLSIFDGYPKINAIATQGVYLDNWYKDNSDSINLNVTSQILKRNILWYGLFKLSPLLFRPAFYNAGRYWSTNSDTSKSDDFLASYSVLEYLSKLTDFTNEKNSFVSITNSTTHEFMPVQPPEYKVTKEFDLTKVKMHKYMYDQSYYAQTAALLRIGEFLEYLKKNGVYDNSRIILYADHGGGYTDGLIDEWDNFETEGPTAYNPLMFVKDFNAAGEPKIDSKTFMPNAEVPYLATRNLGFTPVNPFTGKEIDNSMKKDGILITYEHMFMPHHTRSQYIFTVDKNSWYRVRDNVFDCSNWKREPKEF